VAWAPSARAAPASGIVDHARGWTYRERPPEPAVATTSGPRRHDAGGVSSLVICRSELIGTREMSAKLDADSERAVWDGLAWLGSNWVPTGAMTPDPSWRRSSARRWERGSRSTSSTASERAGVLAAVEWMAQMDWYGAGAASLLATQLRRLLEGPRRRA